MCHNLNLSVAGLADQDRVAEVASAAVDLDTVVQELFERGDVEDFIRGGLRGVDDILWKTSSMSTLGC